MFRKHLQHLLLMFAVALLAFGMTPSAMADNDQRLVVFGDSLSDPGNAFVLTMDVELPPFELIPDAPYARGGLHFSNGKTWVEQLAAELDAQRSTRPALLKPVVFSNYAVGGSRARPESPFDLASQVQLFLRDFGGAAPEDALYVVYFGSNDARDALAALVTDPSGATSAMILQSALGAIRDNLLVLHAAGVRRFLVPNVPNLALVPAVRLQGPAAQAAAQWVATSFNDGLAGVLNALESSLAVEIVPLDVFAALNEVVAAPGAFGLTEVEMPCITPDTRVHPYCARPDQYLFWDGIHPTRAGHRILAGRAGAALGVSVKPAVRVEW
jgi:phospholipase/lecithinase/hemolysin